MSDLNALLLSHADDFHFVVPFSTGKDRLVALDMTADNVELTHEIVSDTQRFSDYINHALQRSSALYGIGGYGEHRAVYGRSAVFDAEDPGEEPRRLHLGLDIWGQAGTPVYAPLAGTVHSFAFNDLYGDYGATIILAHQLEGKRFFSLYGHLSLADLQPLEEGMPLRRGQIFAHFGPPEENGHWPPHLHLQLIIDMGSAKGDYPGVCRYSEREAFLANCPDPDLLARLYRFLL